MNRLMGLARARPGSGPAPAADVRRILTWVYIARFCLALALLLWMAGELSAAPGVATQVAWIILVTAAVTIGSWVRSHRAGVPSGSIFLHGQVFFDLLLVTAVVSFSGGDGSIFAPLYILAIGAGAMLLPMAGALIGGFLAAPLFFAAAWSGGAPAESGLLLHAALFILVALVTTYFAERLRRAGAELGEVRTELRRLRLDTSEILESIGTGILTVDGSGRLAYMNRAALDLLRLDSSVWLDQPILEHLDEIAPGMGAVIERTAALRAPIRRFETEPAGEEGFVLGVSTTVLDRPAEEQPPVNVIFQDITEKKRVEALRRRAERLEAVAELSASLAHEIKNPLASIRSAVEQIADSRVDPEDARVLGGLIVRETERLSRLLSEFIDFARVKLTAPTPLDLAAIVTEVAAMVGTHPDARERGIKVRCVGASQPIEILGAEDLLHRAVFNLALNAAQWSAEGGAVELVVDEVRSDLLSPALGIFRLVRLAVRDTGPGVPEEIRDQIFDPFFTRRQGGTGLGLALVQRAVEAHGGAIFVDAAPGSGPGAIFTLYLPSAPSDQEVEVGTGM